MALIKGNTPNAGLEFQIYLIRTASLNVTLEKVYSRAWFKESNYLSECMKSQWRPLAQLLLTPWLNNWLHMIFELVTPGLDIATGLDTYIFGVFSQ